MGRREEGREGKGVEDALQRNWGLGWSAQCADSRSMSKVGGREGRCAKPTRTRCTRDHDGNLTCQWKSAVPTTCLTGEETLQMVKASSFQEISGNNEGVIQMEERVK